MVDAQAHQAPVAHQAAHQHRGEQRACRCCRRRPACRRACRRSARGYSSSAASAAAPAPSATVFSISSRATIARSMVSSSTSSTSSTRRRHDRERQLAHVAYRDALGDGVAAAPATGRPCRRWCIAVQDFDSTPMTCDARAAAPWPRSPCRRSARRRRSAPPGRRAPARPPASRAPPCPGRRSPAGRRTGGRRSGPRARRAACACAAASASVSPSSTTSAPCTCVLFTFMIGVPRGITITAARRGAPRGRRRPARGCRRSWRSRRAGARPPASVSSLLSAPRSLNEAVNCRFSNFSHTSPPVSADSVRLCRQGVRSTAPAMRAAAARIIGQRNLCHVRV